MAKVGRGEWFVEVAANKDKKKEEMEAKVDRQALGLKDRLLVVVRFAH